MQLFLLSAPLEPILKAIHEQQAVTPENEKAIRELIGDAELVITFSPSLPLKWKIRRGRDATRITYLIIQIREEMASTSPKEREIEAKETSHKEKKPKIEASVTNIPIPAISFSIQPSLFG